MMALPRDQEDDARVIIPELCQGELRLENASFRYEEAGMALEATNVVIRPGQRVALIGPVGSGKSTMIKILSGLYKPTEGRAFLDGIDMSHLAPEFLREQIGYLTQDVRLFNGTLRENLTLGLPSPTDTQILAAAARTAFRVILPAAAPTITGFRSTEAMAPRAPAITWRRWAVPGWRRCCPAAAWARP